ncbi:MAG: triose-phosphate isomerase [Dehalococcoidia bacterium]
MSRRAPVAAGNWKMNTLPSECVALCAAIEAALAGADSEGVEVVICPPFTHLGLMAQANRKRLKLGAQNLSAEPKGAFTGEVSAAMIAELAEFAIVGHSERRQYFGETDDLVRRKLHAALEHGLTPIVCVGESLAQRDAGQVEAVLTAQVRGAFAGHAFAQDVILAYEPVWAIGTGRAANGQQANEALGLIRRELAGLSSPAMSERIRILYGGSMTADNVAEFMAYEHIDGGLIGGASLNAASFATIVQAISAARGT